MCPAPNDACFCTEAEVRRADDFDTLQLAAHPLQAAAAVMFPAGRLSFVDTVTKTVADNHCLRAACHLWRLLLSCRIGASPGLRKYLQQSRLVRPGLSKYVKPAGCWAQEPLRCSHLVERVMSVLLADLSCSLFRKGRLLTLQGHPDYKSDLSVPRQLLQGA